MNRRLSVLLGGGAYALLLAACSGNQPPVPPTPAADSAAIRARADSAAAAARRDSLAAAARADSLARVSADSMARALEAHRADSVRAQVLRDGADTMPATPTGLDSTRAALLAAPVRFETDRAELSADAQQLLERKLDLLRSYRRLEVQVEGHCDARGPDEYNLALGNRRGAAVRDWLVEHGVAAARLTIVSYGEERPADPRSTEEAWAANRRAGFRVTRSAR
jgi:peptidoglycan-associated lipoprotein